jgi:hypothetical protein
MRFILNTDTGPEEYNYEDVTSLEEAEAKGRGLEKWRNTT